jgi:predicted esterase
VQASGLNVWFKEDLDTVDQIVACAVKNYGIDPRRIYAAGCSAGGLFAGYLATNRWQYMAAVTPNSGGSLTPFPSDATHIASVMTMHGAAGRDVVILDFASQSLTFTSAVVSAGGFAVDCDHGGGHCGSPEDLRTSAVTFLLDHPFGVSPEPYGSGLPAGFPAYCQIQ